MKIFNLLAATSVTLLASSCTFPADTGCSSDQECYAGRVCEDGACTGEVTLASNSVTANNVTANNVTANNVTANNVTANNVTPNNATPNNATPNNVAQACMWAPDCADGLVCSPDITTGEQLCVEPWSCDSFTDVFDGGCHAEFLCEDAPRFIDCFQEGDQDSLICRCEPPSEDGTPSEFRITFEVCELPERLADEANRACGWRLPI